MSAHRQHAIPEADEVWIFANLPNWAMFILGFLLFAVLPCIYSSLPSEIDAARRTAAAAKDVERVQP